VKPCLLLLSLVPMLAQAPVHVDYTCTQGDFDWFGLTCSEEQPCAVFFEVSAVDALGSRIVVAGDIHTATTTMYGVVLTTEDGGASWNEAITRPRATAFEQLQIIGDHGWLSGQRLEPLPKDPFFLITSDGGKNWREQPLFGETRFGAIPQFRFETTLSGELIFDDSVGKAVHQELYATKTGGDSWEMRQAGNKALHIKPASDAAWIVTAPPGSKTYLIEHVVSGKRQTFARFLIHIGDCK
jgi:photosystem II stability/assembly factor-like uncharacterized protein